MTHLNNCFYFWPKHLLTFVEGLSGQLEFKPYGNLIIAAKDSFEVHNVGSTNEERTNEYKCIILEDSCKMKLDFRGSQAVTLTIDKSEMETMIARYEIEPYEGYSIVKDDAIADSIFDIYDQQLDINIAHWNLMRLIYNDGPIELKLADKRLAKAIAWMYQHPAANVTLLDVANQVHLSESRLATLFKSLLGATFNRVKLILRLMYFIERYAASNDLTASCLDAGFHDLSHFHKAYRLAFGMAPSLIFDNKQPPEIFYNADYNMKWYGQWLENEFCELIEDKEEVTVMELISSFL